MDKKTIKAAILNALNNYCSNEEAYGDDAYLEIDKAASEVKIISDDEADNSPCDCYQVMAFLRPDPENPALWQPDEEIVNDVIAEED